MSDPIKLKFINQLDVNLSSSKLIQVILGPRQVGKTTTVLHYLKQNHDKKFHYVNADMVFNTSPEWLREQWQEAKRLSLLLVVDEIQKCENWAEVVKSLWDADKLHSSHVSCILLGSSSLKIQKGLTESLTGRFQLIHAYHWNAQESHLGYSLNFEQFLKYGGYPGSYQFVESNEWRHYVMGSIISTVIEKDILQFNTVKKPALFKQAFEILMSYPAMEISYNKLLGQLQDNGNIDLIKYYLELYQGAFLLKVLEKYSTKKIKIKSSSPKILPLTPCFYFLGILDWYTPEERGRAFEVVVGAQLFRTGYDLHYWREGNVEVDYVLKVGRKVFAIEVKSGRHSKPKGLDVFLKKFKGSTGVIITEENYQQFETDPMAFLNSLK